MTQRTDIEWNTGEGIEEGDFVRRTAKWYEQMRIPVPLNRQEYEVLCIEPDKIVPGEIAYRVLGHVKSTQKMLDFYLYSHDVELARKGHKPLKDKGPMV